MEVEEPRSPIDDYVRQLENERETMRVEIARCHKEMQKIARHDREIKMVWAHHAHMQNYASTLEEENVELKIENEVLKDMVTRLQQQRNVRRAIFLDTPDVKHKRQKTDHSRPIEEIESESESESDSDEDDDWRKRKSDDSDNEARKRLKRQHLISEQTKKRPSAWGAGVDTTIDDGDEMIAADIPCNHCLTAIARYKTEHFFCGDVCYMAFYNKM